MANAVFTQNRTSVYKDEPGIRYHFPKRYLNVVRETIGDFVVFYEGRRDGGAEAYLSVQRVLAVEPDPDLPGHFFAVLDQGSEWEFERRVARADAKGLAYEKSLRGPTGRPMSGGASVSAVRRLSTDEFSAICSAGLKALDGPDAQVRDGDTQAEKVAGFAEEQSPFGPAPIVEWRAETLTSRKLRDASFARMVKAAYGGCCAISGLDLRNGGGRPEVEAAHIRPVKNAGPDRVQNGLALSGTLHWMFDRGLISVAPDYRILISHNKVPLETVARLIRPEQRLLLPRDRRHHPHPDYLRFHREEIFGKAA